MTNKANSKYKVHTGYNGRGARYVYFATLDAASDFCNEARWLKNVILSIVEVKR